MSSLEQIGAVTTRSSGLIVVDTGYLGIWSHDRPPVLPDGALNTEEDTRRANGFDGGEWPESVQLHDDLG
jgi:hypothetical protein